MSTILTALILVFFFILSIVTFTLVQTSAITLFSQYLPRNTWILAITMVIGVIVLIPSAFYSIKGFLGMAKTRDIEYSE